MKKSWEKVHSHTSYFKRTKLDMIRTIFLSIVFFLTTNLESYSQSNWTGAINNSWNNADNWNPSGVPGPGDDVIINSGDINISSSPVAEVNSLTMNGGNLEVSGSLSLTINGSSNIKSGASLETRGSLILNNNLIVEGLLELTGGTGILGPGNLTIDGDFTWSGSNIEITGSFVNNGTIAITIAGSQLRTTLVNHGTVEQNGSFFINDNGKYINNGIHDFQDNNDMTEGGTNLGFTNNGSVIKSGGTSRSDIQPEYDGSGSVEAQIGTIDFRGNSTQTGTLISSGGSIRFPTFTHSFSGVSIQGTGFTEVNGATVTIDSDVSATNLKFDGGKISGIANLTVTNSMIWLSGRLGNSVDAGQVIIESDFMTHEINGYFLGTTLISNGNATWGGGQWGFETNGVFINNGTFDIQSNADMDGITKMIINNGTWIKSSGISSTSISPIFTNNGTISLETGELQLFNGSNTGIITTTPGTTLDFGGSNTTFTNESGGTIGGTGNITIDGNLVNNGSLLPGASPGILTIPSAANLTFGSTSTIDMEIGGTTVGTEYDQMNLTGTFILDGTLNISLINSFTPSIGDSFDLIKYTNYTGQLATINLPTIAGLSLDIIDEIGLIKLAVSEENIAPVLDNSANIQLTAIDEDSTNPVGNLISDIETGTGVTLITDTNGPQEGIAVIAVDNTNGAWQYSLDNGTTWVDFGTPSITTARLLLRDVNNKIRFVPLNNFNGIVNSGLTFHAWDQYLSTSEGNTADVSVAGGITPFSIASETISITVNPINDTPALSNSIVDQMTNEDEVFSLTIPANTFEDIDAGDMLTLSATLSDNSSIPNWLIFDGSIFSGTPSNDNVGTISVKLTATDLSGTSTNDEFIIEVINVNDAPVLDNPIDDQMTQGGQEYNFSFPENVFSDIDTDDALTYSATLSDDSTLPTWLNFDDVTRTFSGTPENTEAIYSIKVIATDILQATAIDEFDLNVSLVLSIETVSNRLQIFVSPNPFQNEYQLQLINVPAGEIVIEIFDTVGRIVYANKRINTQSKHKESINFQHQPNGVYLLTVAHSKRRLIKRIVKK